MFRLGFVLTTEGERDGLVDQLEDAALCGGSARVAGQGGQVSEQAAEVVQGLVMVVVVAGDFGHGLG